MASASRKHNKSADVPASTASAAAKRTKKSARFEIPRGEADSRTLVHLIGAFINRIDILRRRSYLGDMDQAIVAGMVGIGSVDHMVLQPEFRGAYGDMRTVVGVEGQRGMNALSIAEATGIPRETVRRKLKELTGRGVVMEKVRGRYIMKPGFIQQPENIEAINEAMRQLLQLMNACIQLGIVELQDTDE